jgi:hypothetical protein
MGFVADRKIFKIAVTPDAKKALESFSERYDMTEYAVASRLYEWFGGQDDLLQRAIVGMLHGLEVDAAKEFMRRLSGSAKVRRGSQAEPSVAEHHGEVQKGAETHHHSFAPRPAQKSPPPKHSVGQSPARKT